MPQGPWAFGAILNETHHPLYCDTVPVAPHASAFSHPDCTVGSGLSPDLCAESRLASSVETLRFATTQSGCIIHYVGLVGNLSQGISLWYNELDPKR